MADVLHASKTAEYFAQVIDYPWLVKQGRLDELQEQMGAGESIDFQLSTYQDVSNSEVVRVGRLFHLPFRLSLGLHESVEPIINTEATLAIFGAYKAVEPLHPKAKGLPLRAQKAERARSAIGGAFIEASADRRQLELIQEGIKFAYKNRLLDLVDKIDVKSAVKVLGRS